MSDKIKEALQFALDAVENMEDDEEQLILQALEEAMALTQQPESEPVAWAAFSGGNMIDVTMDKQMATVGWPVIGSTVVKPLVFASSATQPTPQVPEGWHVEVEKRKDEAAGYAKIVGPTETHRLFIVPELFDFFERLAAAPSIVEKEKSDEN